MAESSHDSTHRDCSETESLLGSEPKPRYEGISTEAGIRDPTASTSRNLGYESRRSPARKGTFIDTEFGAFLALADASPISEEEGHAIENPVTVALHRCRQFVIRPYNKLLLTVGWLPVFDDVTSCWHGAVNIIHPLIVICLVLLGYVIQYAACFRRDSAIQTEDWAQVTIENGSTPGNNDSNGHYECHKYLISQYIIPDVLHSIAYGYSFYLLRITQSEQLPTLMERVFLQTSPTQTGFLSQGRLIRTMRSLLYVSALWVLLSLAAQIMHIVAQYHYITFSWMTPSNTFQRVILLVLMLMGFVALDVVYSVVVINYCVQCALLIFYIEGLQEQLRQSLIDLRRGVREIAEIEVYLRHLNYNTALALSLVLFNFGTQAVLGFVTLLDADSEFSTLMYVSTSCSVVFWVTMMLLPIIQAARLSAGCNALRKLGHELRVRPFGYRDVSDQDLDSFLLYTSSLNMRAKLFLVPVRTWFLCTILVIICFIILLLFQTGNLHIWLK